MLLFQMRFAVIAIGSVGLGFFVSCSESGFSGGSAKKKAVKNADVSSIPAPHPEEADQVTIVARNQVVLAGETLTFKVDGVSSTKKPVVFGMSKFFTATLDESTGVFNWKTTTAEVGEHTLSLWTKSGAAEAKKDIKIFVSTNANPPSNEYELCQSQDYKALSLLFIDSENQSQYFDPAFFADLGGLGVEVRRVSQSNYIKENINPSAYNQVWLISGRDETGAQQVPQMYSGIKTAYENGKGIMIFADNAPLFYHANILSKELGIVKSGQNLFSGSSNDTGEVPVKVRSGALSPGFAIPGPLFSGLVTFIAGITLSGIDAAALNIPATISVLSPASAYSIAYAESVGTKGRLVFDGGFTKLMGPLGEQPSIYQKLGTPRYLRNVVCYLSGK